MLIRNFLINTLQEQKIKR